MNLFKWLALFQLVAGACLGIAVQVWHIGYRPELTEAQAFRIAWAPILVAVGLCASGGLFYCRGARDD